MQKRRRGIAVGIGMVGFHLSCADGWLARDKNFVMRRNLEADSALLAGRVESKRPVLCHNIAKVATS